MLTKTYGLKHSQIIGVFFENNKVINAFIKYSDIQYNGDVNTPVAYAMLEALQPGQNYSWNMILQKKILMGLQLSVSYEGRKSEESDAIHIGRMQVSALF